MLVEGLGFMHVGIQVGDMEASLRFYRDLLGLGVVVDVTSGGWLADVRSGNRDAEVRICVLRGAGQTIELLEWIPPVPHGRVASAAAGVAHLAFRVGDVSAAHRELLAEGVDFLFPPREVITGEPMTFAVDPDGVLIELIQVGPEGPAAEGLFG